MEENRQKKITATASFVAIVPENQIPTDYLLLEQESSQIKRPAVLARQHRQRM
jgi:hypothetical protein